MNFFKEKSPKRLENQLENAETLFGGTFPSPLREELLTLSLDELKGRYPDIFKRYLSAIQTEAELVHFPGINQELQMEQPKISFLPATARGYAFKLQFHNEAHVIKPVETATEREISEKAAFLGIGAQQFETKPGFIHEEFIEGTPLLKLKKEECTPAFMELLGEKVMGALKKLHEENILVNDQLLTNDFGKSHIIIDKKGEVRFVDFGAAINLEHISELSQEEIFSLMRTDMMYANFRMHTYMAASPEGKRFEEQEYCKHVLPDPLIKEDLIHMKDMQFLNEGIGFLSHRLPNIESFITGLKKKL